MAKSAFNKTHRTVKKNIEGGDDSDQFQTPSHALPMVMRYIPKGSTIWEPCAGKGNIKRWLEENEYGCFATDIMYDPAFDFFKFNPTLSRWADFDWRYIVTNPPWSLKIEWTIRCLELGRPFALLMPLTFLEAKGSELADKNCFEIIKPYYRIAYETPYDGWWRHYGKKPGSDENCRYTQREEFDVCPECGERDEIRQVTSVPQKQSIWVTHRLNIGTSLLYYDNSADIAKWRDEQKVARQGTLDE